MRENALGMLMSTLCGALIGFVMFFMIFDIEAAFELTTDPKQIKVGMLGAFIFGVAGLASGITLVLNRGIVGSSAIAHALVGALASCLVLAGVSVIVGITSATNVTAILFLVGICCLPGLAFYSTCKIFQYFTV